MFENLEINVYVPHQLNYLSHETNWSCDWHCEANTLNVCVCHFIKLPITFSKKILPYVAISLKIEIVTFLWASEFRYGLGTKFKIFLQLNICNKYFVQHENENKLNCHLADSNRWPRIQMYFFLFPGTSLYLYKRCTEGKDC